MERVSVTEAALHFDKLIDRVAAEGVTVELERDQTVVARLSPAGSWAPAESWVRIADLNRLFASLPSLGDDAESFARDMEAIRAARF